MSHDEMKLEVLRMLIENGKYPCVTDLCKTADVLVRWMCGNPCPELDQE